MIFHHYRRHSFLLACAFLPLTIACNMASPIKIEPVKISYLDEGGKARENLVTYEKPRQKSIRIARFVDKRPSVQRNGDHPHLIFLLLGWWRIGDYVTSDKTWTDGASGKDAVPQLFSETIADCIKQSNFFENVKIEDSTSPSGGDGLILKGEIETCYASQHLKQYGYFFLVWFGKQQKIGTPQAVCKLKYELIDAESNQSIKTGSVESKAGEKDTTMSAVTVGLQAIRGAQTLLVNDVNQRALQDF